MNKKEMFLALDEWTKPPEDGDYDGHITNAMSAVFDLLNSESNLKQKFEGELNELSNFKR